MTINEKNTAFLFIDIQEKLVQMLKKDKITKKTYILSEMANILGIEKIFTEQYPKGLGSTIDSISKKDSDKTFEKTAFNALETEGLFETIKEKENIFVCGIETHICVYQTVKALLENGYNVFVIKDACASRETDEFKAGINLMEKLGATITTTEIVLFELLKTSKHPQFKLVQALIK